MRNAKRENLKVIISAAGQDPIETTTEEIEAAAASIGHNSTSASAEKLKSFLRRIEKLEEDRKAVAEDVREVYGEAKAIGFDTRVIRIIVRDRKMEEAKRKERDELLSLYRCAMGIEE